MSKPILPVVEVLLVGAGHSMLCDLARAIKHRFVAPLEGSIDVGRKEVPEHVVIVAKGLTQRDCAAIGYWAGRGRKVLVLTRPGGDFVSVCHLPTVRVETSTTVARAIEIVRAFLPEAAPTYVDYLKTTQWAARRERALDVAEGRCQLCYSTDDLNVHHRTYIRLGDERPTDLVVLCRACHARHHQALPARKEG